MEGEAVDLEDKERELANKIHLLVQKKCLMELEQREKEPGDAMDELMVRKPCGQSRDRSLSQEKRYHHR